MIETKAKPGTWVTGTGPSADDLMVCENGVVDLRAFAEGRSDYLLPHSPRLFAMSKRAFAFDPEAKKPTRWMQFMNEVWPGDAGSQALLQEFLGYCLTDDTKFQKFLMLVGIPRGGKGTIVRLLTELVGTDNVHSVRLGQCSHRFALENAIGKSLLLIPDAKLPKGDKQPEIVELIKAITGRDMINIDRKNLAMVSIPLPLKIVITSNDLLALPDDSSALYMRMLTLQFTQSFEDQPEFDLDEKLIEELPGIALWAIEGWKRLQFTQKFTESKSGRAMTKKLEEAANPIVAFRDANCVTRSDAIISKDVLFRAYHAWCEEHELPTCSKNIFCSKLYSACPGVDDGRRTIDGNRVPCFMGITLRNVKTGDDHPEIRLFERPQRVASNTTESTLVS